MSTLSPKAVPAQFDVISYDLPPFVGDWTQMDYGNPLDPRLLQLREEYRLDDIIAAADEFSALLALKRWVRSRWNHGWSRGFGTVKDALDILHEADRGEQFNCGFYARVFVECARALGFVARQVGIQVADCSRPRDTNIGNVGHSVPEVWSNEFRKWLLLDPDLNVYYRREGVPLSALEMHEAWLAGEAESVEMIQDEPRFIFPTGRALEMLRENPGFENWDEQHTRRVCERFTKHRALDYYARLGIGRYAWLDPRCLPTFVVHFNPGGGQVYTSEVADLYWSVNLVRLSAQASWEGMPQLAVKLEHCLPWFDRYEVAIDSGEWQARPASFDWPIQPGRNVLQVRAVNVCGRSGVTSQMEVVYA